MRASETGTGGPRTADVAGSVDVGRLRSGRLVLVGYSGSDRRAIERHIDELARHGIPRPASVPAIWEVPSSLLTQDATVRARAGRTSGEAEPVIIVRDGEAQLTVGSDHTDRELERASLEEAKRACPKVIAEEAWQLPDDAAWQALRLRSSVLVNGHWEPYQEATLGELLPPSWFLERFGGDGDVTIYCGTVPVMGELQLGARRFRAELHDPATGRGISCEYEVLDDE